MPKKSANTNKTAHVMNLISKNTAPAPAASPEAPTEAAATAAAAPPPSAPSPVVLPSLNADLEVSSQIKSALEDLLEEPPAAPKEPDAVSAPEPSIPQEEAPAPSTEAPAAPKEPEAVSAPEPSIPQEETPAPSPEATAAPKEPEAVSVPEPSIPQEEAPAPSTEASEPEEPIKAEKQPQPSAQTVDPEKMVCVNIMQSLVEESVHRYIEMFGLCSCPRCIEDVKAIALNNLVPKYVVTPEKERSPRVIIYNERYHAEVTAQILRACKTVMDNPLHD